MHIHGYSSIREQMRAGFTPAGEEEDKTASSASGGIAAVYGEDTVTISEKARSLSEMRTAMALASPEEEGAGENAAERKGPLNGLFDDFDVEALGALGKAIENTGSMSPAGESTINGTDQNLNAIKKQLEAAQKQLDKANQALQKATSEARSDPAVVSEDDSKDVKEARNVVTEANNRVLQLQEQINRATRDAYGMGPGGGVRGGTPAQGGIGAKPSGHIGEATDPYAAARAFEQAERSGGSGGGSAAAQAAGE